MLNSKLVCVHGCAHLHYMRVLSDGICIINCKYTRPVRSPLRKPGFEHNSSLKFLKGFVRAEIICVGCMKVSVH